MDDTALQQSVEEHIAKNRVREAFEQLKHKIHDRKLHQRFIGRWREFSENEHAYHSEVITRDQYIGYKSTIADKFLELIHLIFSDRSERSRRASEWMQAGQSAMDNGDFQLADDYFQQVLNLLKDHLQATFERAVVALNQGQFAVALTGFTKVITAEPDNHLALHNRGVVHLLSQRNRLACEDWQRVKKLGFSISDSALAMNCESVNQ